MALASLALAASPSLHLAAAVTSSHNAVAERQFRLPLEYGGQRTPTSQWTATAAGCVILERGPGEVQIGAVMAGRIVDGGIKDGANMGAAMAPAAAGTSAALIFGYLFGIFFNGKPARA